MRAGGEQVPADGWVDAVAGCRARGLTMLDLYTAVDHGDTIELVLRLSSPQETLEHTLTTSLDGNDPAVASLAPILRAADWHEREMAEMFGIAFAGHPDPRPLLLRVGVSEPPLRRRVPLDKRVGRVWPGIEQTQRRRARRQLAPGVREEWIEGGER